MDNLDDSENNAKISDSGYSNSCSNSQSRRSHSSKSTHSGSNFSGSSGYGGKPSTSGSSTNLGPQLKKDKESKKKKNSTETTLDVAAVQTETRPTEPQPSTSPAMAKEETSEVIAMSPAHPQSEKGAESMDLCTPESKKSDEVCNISLPSTTTHGIPRYPLASNTDGFSCVISMDDGVVMCTKSSLTTTLGFPKDMWLGRSFLDFVHPKDRSTFAAQITSDVAVPKIENGTKRKVKCPRNSSLVCRIRRYRGLGVGFGVRDKAVVFLPFFLNLTFKKVCDDEDQDMYLVVRATPFISAYKVSFEQMDKAVPFVIKHAANGNIEYIDPESVPYMGYVPQDLIETDALILYHPNDLAYLRQVYETIVKSGKMSRCKRYRMKIQNGDYITLESEWSSYVNPWSKKLEFIIGRHHVIEGPANPEIFAAPFAVAKISEDEKNREQNLRESIIRILNETLTKPAIKAKQLMNKRYQELANYMEILLDEQPKVDVELRLDTQDNSERDSVMLGGISPHHDDNDSGSSSETPPSYNQLNYNDNLQRYFYSQQQYRCENNSVEKENHGSKDTGSMFYHCLSPIENSVAQNSVDTVEMNSSSDTNAFVCTDMMLLDDLKTMLLTEELLTRHNIEMEKVLTKTYRESRFTLKLEREKSSAETRQKKIEHISRCNAAFQPTGATDEDFRPHGVKRGSKFLDDNVAHKHHCSSSRQMRRRRDQAYADVAQHSTVVGASEVPAVQWPPRNNLNTYYTGNQQQLQHMPIMGHVPAVAGKYMH